MRLLIIDTFGESVLDWALRCKADSHQVKWFISDQKAMAGRGLIERVPDWRPWMVWADIVFLPDNLKYLRELDFWRAKGVKIIGPSVEGAAWELNRTLGMKVLEKHGIQCPAYKEFNNYDQAIAYVKREDRAFVSKPCGEETDKALSYVAKSPADLIYMLERWKKSSKLNGSFILQERIDGVCEMGVGGWFGPGGFNQGWEENWEHKKMMPGDLGVNTGEMGTVMRFVRKSKLAKLMLEPMADALEKMGYIGCVDVNCIIDKEGQAWPLEFTMRPGWPAFLIQQSLHKGDHLEWLYDLAEGRDARCIQYDKIAVGVVMALPDFPYSRATKKETHGVPLYGLKPSIMDDIHPCQVMMGTAPVERGGKIVTEPMMVTAGDYVLVATGTGETVRLARDKAYRVLNNLKSTPSSPFWRIDIGRKMAKELEAIQPMGYATGMVF